MTAGMRLAPADLELVIATHGRADPGWVRRFEIPGDDAFPALVVPADKMEFSGARAYPISFETDGDRLFVQISSFDLKEGPDS